MYDQAWQTSVERLEVNKGDGMLKRIMAIAIAIISILIPKHTKAEEIDMNEIIIQGSQGKLYGILHGDRDGIVPLRYSERAVDVYENAELVVMASQNHGFSGKARAEAMEWETAFFREHTR